MSRSRAVNWRSDTLMLNLCPARYRSRFCNVVARFAGLIGKDKQVTAALKGWATFKRPLTRTLTHDLN